MTSHQDSLTINRATHLIPGLALDPAPESPWLALTARPLLIFVGLTGVGKSTTVAHLQKSAPELTLLPNRRILTDALIIGMLQETDGQPIEPVHDRQARFAYTARYRTLFPGGMAHALSRLAVHSVTLPDLLIFDGLRGDNEVRHAARLMPLAHFVVLDAPDLVRVTRLLERADRFDQTEQRDQVAPSLPLHGHRLDQEGATGVALHEDVLHARSEAAGILTTAELDALVAVAQDTPDGIDDLRAKLKIVATERRSYDPQATQAALLEVAPTRTLVIDTVAQQPAQAAAAILAKLEAWGLRKR